MQQELTELYRAIERLMEAAADTQDQDLQDLLDRAKQYKQTLEGRLGVRN